MFFICAMVYIFSIGEKWNVLFNLASPRFHLSPRENICTITHMTIHYLYIIYGICFQVKTLRIAIDYIHELREMLHDYDTRMGTAPSVLCGGAHIVPRGGMVELSPAKENALTWIPVTYFIELHDSCLLEALVTYYLAVSMLIMIICEMRLILDEKCARQTIKWLRNYVEITNLNMLPLWQKNNKLLFLVFSGHDYHIFLVCW